MSGIIKKILFVEDDPVVLTLYRNRLQREGFEILFAEDGQVALNVLARVKPDVVVLDLMLPKVNGVDVLKHIRADANLKSTPVLILSNAYMTDLANKAMQSGANKGMLKTECTPAKLLDAIQDLLGILPMKPKPGKSQAEAFVAAAAAAHADEMSIKATREEFIEDAPGEVAKIRDHCLAYIKAATQPAGLQRLNQLYQRVHFLSARAGLAGCAKVALLASAFEALLFEVVFKPADVTPSILQTIAQAVDCLGRLFQNNDIGTAGLNSKAKILVVDDDAVCNYTMVAALKRAHFEPVSVEDPAAAVELAQSARYDIVLLDINMPGMSGFQLCETLRRMPQYKETPVIFITGNGDFQNRAQSILSGGNDLITKPTSPLELVLKTTMHLLQPHGRRPEGAGETAQHSLPAVLQSAKAMQNSQPQAAEPEPEAAPPEMPSVPAPEAEETEAPVEQIQMPVHEEMEEPAEPIKLSMAKDNAEPAGRRPMNGSFRPEAQTDAQPRINGTTRPEGINKPIRAETNNGSSRFETPNDPPRLETANGSFRPKLAGPMRNGSANGNGVPNGNGAANGNGARNGTVRFSLAPEVQPPVQRKPLSKPTTVQRALPPTNMKPDLNMEKTQTTSLDEISDGVARIIFGDENLTDMNIRLTRIALERYNVSEGQSFDEAAQSVARIIFGDENLSDMNVRLTRIALERYNVAEILNRPADVGNSSNRSPRLAAVSL
jgi:DNA-binding response OmpR family regulator